MKDTKNKNHVFAHTSEILHKSGKTLDQIIDWISEKIDGANGGGGNAGILIGTYGSNFGEPTGIIGVGESIIEEDVCYPVFLVNTSQLDNVSCYKCLGTEYLLSEQRDKLRELGISVYGDSEETYDDYVFILEYTDDKGYFINTNHVIPQYEWIGGFTDILADSGLEFKNVKKLFNKGIKPIELLHDFNINN